MKSHLKNAFASVVIGAVVFGVNAPASAQSIPGTPYVGSSEASSFVPLANPTVLWTSADDSSLVVTLPFPFRFYDTNETAITVSTNGVAVFGSQTTVSLANVPPGNPLVPNGYIAPFWQDLILYSSANARVGHEVLGQAPSRVFVIEWRDISDYPDATTRLNFQIRLFEGNAGRIEIQYGPVTGTFSGDATMGMEDQAGARPILFAASGCTEFCAQGDLTALAGRKLVYTQTVEGKELGGVFGTWPRGALPGSRVNGAISIGNVGTVTATSVRSDIFLSLDAQLDASDVSIGSVVRDVGGQSQVEVSVNVTIPTAQPAADYTLLLAVDSTDIHRETNESNNVVVGPRFATGTDLSPRTLTAPAVSGLNVGETVRSSLEISNMGVPRSGNVDVRISLSNDRAASADDVVLGTTSVVLTGQATETFEPTLTIPSLPPGLYYLVAELDPANAVPELVETNNTISSSGTLRVGVDFSVGIVTPPAQLDVGQSGSVGVTIESRAAAYTGSVDYRLHLSSDAQLDSNDPDLGVFTANFTGQTSVTANANVQIPANTARGVYRVIAEIDPQSAVAEVDETNNTAASGGQLVVGIDLSIVANSIVNTPTSVESDQPFQMTAQISVLGGARGTAAFRIFASLDPVRDAADPVILDGSITLTGEAVLNWSTTVRMPGSIPPGAYYLILVLDPEGALAEANETNNEQASQQPVTIRGADLYVESVSAPDVAFFGVPLEVRIVIENSGVAAARGFRYAYHLSDNDICRVSDPQIFLSNTTTIGAGRTEEYVDLVPIPTFTSTRSAWLCAFADIASAISETSESNNIRKKDVPIRIITPIPNLSGEILGAPTSAAAGEDLAVTRIIRNNGVFPAPSFAYRYVLSPNTTVDASDLPAGGATLSLDIGEDDYGIDVVRIPPGTPAGTYYLGLILDPDDRLIEVGKADNIYVGPSINVFAAGLRFEAQTLPMATVGVLYEVAVRAFGAAILPEYSVAVGALPDGVSLDASSGLLSGVPSREGVFVFTIRARAGSSQVDFETQIRVIESSTELTIATLALPSAVAARDYTTKLSAVGGVPPYKWSSNNLPAGFTLDADGNLTGRSEQPATVLASYRVEDGLGQTARRDLALNVLAADQLLRLGPQAFRDAIIGEEYCQTSTKTFAASRGLENCVDCTFMTVTAPPPGMSVGRSGNFCGVPEQVGSFFFVVRAQDPQGVFDTAGYVLNVVSGTKLAISTASLPDGTVEEAYSARVEAIRGTEPYTFSLVQEAGNGLPPGVSFTDGLFSGTPSSGGTYTFTVQVVDAKGRSDLQPLSILVDDPNNVAKNDPGGCGCNAADSQKSPSWGGIVMLSALGLLVLRGRARGRKLGARHSAFLVLMVLSMASLATPSTARAQLVPGTPYVLDSQPVTYQDLVSPTVLWTDVDDGAQNVNLPFSFKYYDQVVTSVSIGANGAIAFPGGQSVSLSNEAPGTPSGLNGFVAPFWDDLRLFAGSIGHAVSGTAPNRTFTIEYKTIQRCCSNTGPSKSFQVRLFEGLSGRIEIDYGPITSSGGAYTATMGMEDQAGARPIQFRTPACGTSCTQADFEALSGRRVIITQDPGVELIATRIEGPAFAFLGAETPLDISFASLHGEPIGPFRYELSASSQKDGSNPVKVGEGTVTLAPFEQKTLSVVARPPSSLGEREVYWVLTLDADGTFAEVNEVNNTFVSARGTRLLPGAPDLSVRRVVPSATTVNAGDNLSVRATIDNVGGLPTANTFASVMLSTNPVISAQDIELARFPVDLGPGESITTTISATIPSDANSGSYYIGIFADADKAATELSEANNGRAAVDSIRVMGTGVRIVTTRLPAAFINQRYLSQISAFGGDQTFRFELVSGSLPEGLNLEAATGRIFGTPVRVEAQNFRVKVTSGGFTHEADLTMQVIAADQPLTIVNREIAPAVVAQEYAFELITVGADPAAALTWSANNLPNGLSIEASKTTTALLSGSVDAEGDYTFEVEVTDGQATATREFVLNVSANANLSIVAKTLSTATYGVDYQETLVARGGIAPLRWRLETTASSRLPRGLTLSDAGIISGKPMQVGRFFAIVIVEDAGGARPASDTNGFEIIVEEDSPGNEPSGESRFRITTDDIPPVILGQPYAATIGAEGGAEPYEWRLAEGRMPKGLRLLPNRSGGVEIESDVEGPSETSVTNLLLEVRDDHGRTRLRAFVLRVIEQEVTTKQEAEEGCICVRAASPRSSSAAFWVSLAFAVVLVFVRRRKR